MKLWLHWHTSWTEGLKQAVCGQCWALRNGVSGIFSYYKGKTMALHHSLFREKEGISMEKMEYFWIHLTSSDIGNCLNDTPILYISGSKEENCSALFCIVSKIRLMMVSEQERKSHLSCPSEAFGSLHLAHCGQKYGTKISEIKKDKWKLLLFHEFETIFQN